MHTGIHSIKFRVKGLLNELVGIMWIFDKILLEKRRLASWVSFDLIFLLVWVLICFCSVSITRGHDEEKHFVSRQEIGVRGGA